MKCFQIILVFFFLIINIVYADNWGAIFIDTRTGVTGGSTDFSTEKNAHDAALKSCTDKHMKKGITHKCEHIVGFYNTCAAVYWSPINKRAAWGMSVFENDAQNIARRECAKDGGKDCQLSMSICNTRMIFY